VAGLGGVYTAAALGEKYNIPVIQGYYIPSTPTREYPSYTFPINLPLIGKVINPATYVLGQQLIWQGFRKADKISRREILDMKPAPYWGPFRSTPFRSTPVLYAYSPTVIKPPVDWPANHHVTGYWFLDENQAWTPPPRLLDFLASGPPPVLIGFGSMSSRDPVATLQLILEAIALLGQRAIILTGWGGMREVAVPDNVFMIDSIPHSWILPKVSVVVHHGGAGTTAAGLRAGVPSIIIPFFGDQPFWGRQVDRLGVGPVPIPRKKLTSVKLAKVIKKTMNNTVMRQRAESLGNRIRSENGVGNAVNIIQDYLREHSIHLPTF
jgi:UDP:flavonoid glycosyltransferase YjiC (YdhE family)